MSKLTETMDKGSRTERKIKNIIRLIVFFALIAIMIYSLRRWGIRDGLIYGFLAFLFLGGVDILWGTFTFPPKDKH